MGAWNGWRRSRPTSHLRVRGLRRFVTTPPSTPPSPLHLQHLPPDAPSQVAPRQSSGLPSRAVRRGRGQQHAIAASFLTATHVACKSLVPYSTTGLDSRTPYIASLFAISPHWMLAYVPGHPRDSGSPHSSPSETALHRTKPHEHCMPTARCGYTTAASLQVTRHAPLGLISPILSLVASPFDLSPNTHIFDPLTILMRHRRHSPTRPGSL